MISQDTVALDSIYLDKFPSYFLLIINKYIKGSINKSISHSSFNNK